jgi:hypothetical protein
MPRKGNVFDRPNWRWPCVRSSSALGSQIVHEIVGVVRRLMATHTVGFAKEKSLPAHLRFNAFSGIDLAVEESRVKRYGSWQIGGSDLKILSCICIRTTHPRLLHRWPSERFALKYPRWGAVRESRPPGSVRGCSAMSIPTAIAQL